MVKTVLAVPSAVGCDRPSITTLPLPFGVMLILPLDVETMLLPSTSKSPPNCGVESAATLAIPPLEGVPKDKAPDPSVFNT